MDTRHLIFDRRLVRQRKARASAGLEGFDFLRRRVAEDLAERLAAVRREFPRAVEIGAEGPELREALATVGTVGPLVGLAVDPALALRFGGPALVADEEALPLGPATLDLAVSALVLQQVNDLPGTLVQIRRALRPDGLMLAALLGGDTLCELRAAFALAEAEITGGASPRVAPFADVRALGGLLQRAGFALPVADAEKVIVTYDDPLGLFQDLRGMGLANALVERSRRPMTRGLLGRVRDSYRERFAGADGRVSATFEIVTLTAWAPDPSQQQPLKPGSAQMRLADVLKPPTDRRGRDADGQ
ncbi:MAG: methyltransferase domain-containing protein [Hyphomicrobiaceae bacterium]